MPAARPKRKSAIAASKTLKKLAKEDTILAREPDRAWSTRAPKPRKVVKAKNASEVRHDTILAIYSAIRPSSALGLYVPLEIQTNILGHLEADGDYTSICRMSQVSRSWYTCFSAEHLWEERARHHYANRRGYASNWIETFEQNYGRACFKCHRQSFQKYQTLLPNVSKLAVICYSCKAANPAYATLFAPQVKEQYGLVEEDLVDLRSAMISFPRHLSYLVTDVKAIWLSKLPERKAQLIANLPQHYRQPITDAFATVEAMEENETSLLKRRYHSLLSTSLDDPLNSHTAIGFAKLYMDLGNIREVVQTTLRYKGRSDLEPFAMGYLDQMAPGRQLTTLELLASGQMNIEVVLQFLAVIAPQQQRPRFDGSGRPLCGQCSNQISRSCQQALCGKHCQGPCQMHFQPQIVTHTTTHATYVVQSSFVVRR